MKDITDLLKSAKGIEAHVSIVKESTVKKQSELLTFKCPNFEYPLFKQMIIATCEALMLAKKITGEYTVDQQNGYILKQLYFYITNNPACLWNLNSGLMFAGRPGCGKTLLMTAFCCFHSTQTKKQVEIKHSKEIANWLKTYDTDKEFPFTAPLFIDDIGREETEIKDFGTTSKPVIDLLGLRYESGARTYATTNLKKDMLHKYYGGEYIGSRIDEMMTFVEFPGESRRLKNEVKTRQP